MLLRPAVLAVLCLSLLSYAPQICAAQGAEYPYAGSFSPPYVEGQMIVTLAPGTPASYLESLNSRYQARVISKLPVADTYLVRVPSAFGAAARKTGVVNREMDWFVGQYKADARVIDAAPDHKRTHCAVAPPNDALWSRQWDMLAIDMLDAWAVTKGSSSVTVAVIDNGVSPTHPDLGARLVAGRDIADNDNDATPTPDAAGGHGTHVAGTIAAITNNSIGVAGVCWQGVKVMPLKVFKDAEPDYTSDSLILQALDYAQSRGVQVVNMSLGGPSRPANALWDKIKELNRKGILLVAAAGNSNGPVYFPAAYPECIAVAATDRRGLKTYYSCHGPEIDIAAPGGSGYTDGPDTIWSTWYNRDTGNDYRGIIGTSMAAPHVAGACALLLSAGVAAEEVKTRLYDGATPAGTGARPNDEYGWGILDVYKAFSGSVRILQPAKDEAIETSRPTFVIEVKRVNLDTLVVYVDFADPGNTGRPDMSQETPVINASNYNQYYYPDTGRLIFQWPIGGRDPFSAGKHKIYVQAQSSLVSEQVSSDSAVLFVQPRLQPKGVSMFAVPCALVASSRSDLEDQAEDLLYEVLGSSGYTLARYMPAAYPPDVLSAGWAYFPTAPSGVKNPLPAAYASFAPPDVVEQFKVRPRGVDTDLPTPPAGVGYWLKLSAPRYILTESSTDQNYAYDIDLVTGWNMVGNPFPFKVDWNNCSVRFQGKLLTLADALSKDWLSPTIFRYGASGYVSQTAPAGVLAPWESVWVRVKGNTNRYGPLTLTIPPIRSEAAIPGGMPSLNASTAMASLGTSSGSLAANAASDGWRVRLSVTAGDLCDPENAIGQQSGASDGYGREDVEGPPPSPRGVDLRFVHNDWGGNSGYYETDIRALGSPTAGITGPPQVWQFQVYCTETDRDVEISWPNIANLPKGYALILKDETTGERLRLTEYNRYLYRVGPLDRTRWFTLSLLTRAQPPLNLTVTRVDSPRGAITVRYKLSADASVTAKISGANGEVVKSLGPYSLRAGSHPLTWNGCTAGGALAAKGTYVVDLEATNGLGEKARAACWGVLR